HAQEERSALLARQVQVYIGAHFAEDLTVEFLADVFGLSASHLRKIFKDRTGESLKTHLDRVRMGRARELLLATDHSVADIAAKVGYVSMQTFNRLFKKDCGVTPGEFRRVQAMAQAGK
nr:helix-turn-helix domain-containing protein [Clostridia bacterium]